MKSEKVVQKEPTVSHRIILFESDVDFIQEYKNAGKVKSLQHFVREAVRKMIREVEIEETMEAINKLKEN